MRLLGQPRLEHSAIDLDAKPRAHDVIVEIGLVVAVHLAFALAVAFTLNSFGGA
jgi:hypothetical protein